MNPRLRILLIWLLTASVLIGQAVLPNRRKVFQATDGGETTLNDNLIAYWNMDEEGNDTVNRVDSQGANDLDAVGSTITNAVGLIVNAVDIEKDNNCRLTINDNADLSFGDEDFSVAIWIKRESNGGVQSIIDKSNATGSNREYRLYYDTTANRVKFAVSSDGSTETTVTADTHGSVGTGIWYFVAGGHSAANNNIWISVNGGVKDTASHSTGCRDGTSVFYIGWNAAGNQGDGLFDEAGVWGKELTDAELDELYNAGSGKTCCPFN